jgi:hypothetical protein
MALTLERRFGRTNPANLAEVAGGRTKRHRAPMLPWVSDPDPRRKESRDSSQEMVKASSPIILQESFVNLVMAITGLANQLFCCG